MSPPETHSNVAIAPPQNQAVSLFSDEDDTDLPTVISTDNTTDDAGDIDAEFLKPVDWLSVV